jgi:NADH-quinone oxidoreductase subunit H
MLLVSGMTSIMFLGGWLSPIDIWPLNAIWLAPVWFFIKVVAVFFIFLWSRATFPRFRYDQLMRLGWKVFLPLSLGYLVLVAGYMVATGTLPQS